MITHDLGVVAEMADEIAVMYAGRIVEHAPKDAMFAAPEHPYTWGLLRSIPRLDAAARRAARADPGPPAALINPPSGCAFHPRCPYVREAHKRIDPQLEPIPADRRPPRVACLLPHETRRALWQQLQAGRARPTRRTQAVRHPRGRRRRGAWRARERDPLVEVRDLVKHFPLTRGIVFQRQVGAVQAVDGVSFDVHARARRSASSASRAAASRTTARLIMRLLEPDERRDPLSRAGHRAPVAARSSSRCAARCR